MTPRKIEEKMLHWITQESPDGTSVDPVSGFVLHDLHEWLLCSEPWFRMRELKATAVSLMCSDAEPRSMVLLRLHTFYMRIRSHSEMSRHSPDCSVEIHTNDKREIVEIYEVGLLF